MLYLKSLHIIFIITWFAGMFYIVRLFVYNREAQDEPEPNKSILTQQYTVMIKRLWRGITLPSAILTLILGPLVMWQANYLTDFGFHKWLHIKILFVLLLYVYFFSIHKIYQQQRTGNFKYTSRQLRIWNEVATLLLVMIIFVVVLKQSTAWVIPLLICILLIVVTFLLIRIYKNKA